MTSQDSLLGKLELAVLRHPILVVAALLLLSTGIAVLLPTRDPNVGATIWLITAGAAMIWRWTVPVSYTHLDVYKRQRLRLRGASVRLLVTTGSAVHPARAATVAVEEAFVSLGSLWAPRPC